MEGVRAVGFDLDHTLAIDNKLERVALLRLLEPIERAGGAIATLDDETDAIDRLLERQRSGAYPIDECVRRFVGSHGIAPTESFVTTFLTDAVAMADEFVIPLPGMRELLSGLRERGIATAILSNGWNPLQQRKAQRAGFDGPVIVSGEIGAQKPAPESFAALLHAFDAPAHACCYVGDDPRSDVAGARDAGLHTVWMNWERKAYPADVPAPDDTIDALPKLLELLPRKVGVS